MLVKVSMWIGSQTGEGVCMGKEAEGKEADWI